jgi:hypothetical protein
VTKVWRQGKFRISPAKSWAGSFPPIPAQARHKASHPPVIRMESFPANVVLYIKLFWFCQAQFYFSRNFLLRTCKENQTPAPLIFFTNQQLTKPAKVLI